MEQTLVKQFFPTVKSSFPTQPAKRRKVSDTMSINESAKTQKPRRTVPTMRTPTRQSRTKKSSEISLSRIFNAAPVSASSQETSNEDQHGELKRKVSQLRGKKASKICSTPVETAQEASVTVPTIIEEEDSSCRGSLKVDPWITEQAKLVLHQGRGKASVLAATTQNPVSRKTLKPSDLLKQDQKEDSTAKGNVREECAKKFHANEKAATKGRGRLRQKYAHLTQTESKPPTSAINRESGAATEKTTNDRQSSTSKVPAHKRHKLLAAEKPSAAFTLSQKYKDLLEIFRCVDSVIFLLHRRSEVCTFDRLKKSVQSMLGKQFSEKHLGQLKTVYPNGLVFRIEKNLRDLNGIPSGAQLTVDANYEDSLVSKQSEKKAINQTVLIMRKHLFESSLVNITKTHHQKFLHKLNLQLKDGEFHRWHPHFKLEEVPEIQVSSLPQVSVTRTFTSAKDMLEKSRGVPQVEKALINVAKSTQLEETLKSQNELAAKTNTNTESSSVKANGKNNILKGVSESILERIRQKELKKAELTMLRNPEQEKRLALMDRLPDFVRILKTYFTTERKAAITLEDCVVKFSESFGTSSSAEKNEEHIRLLNELVPEWLHIVNVRKCPYVKLAKNLDVNIILSKLKSIRSEEDKQ